LSHGYIKNDFDVKKWAAPKFLEQAAKQLIEEHRKKGQNLRGEGLFWISSRPLFLLDSPPLFR
jgi:hypothetical protein